MFHRKGSLNLKDFFDLLKKFDLKGIFIIPTNNGFLQFFRYAFVGGIAAIVDFALLFILTDYFGLFHMISAIIAFLGGLITNFTLSKILVFNSKVVEARVNSFFEFLSYAIIGIIGLGITEVILYIFTEKIGLYYMLSKLIATFIVLIWNYLARKMLIYK